MKESTQTLLFIAAALLSVLLATQSQPTDETFEVDELIGESLFAGFEADEAKAMRIVRIDEETATMRDFEVAEKDGVWSLPSRGGYPADGERQMAEATASVIDLKVLDIASQSAADHDEYGVIEPSEKIDVGQTGVGTRVTLTDNENESLVDIVIGKKVKGFDDQRYVRRTSQDVVFIVEIDPSKFSTRFEDWIEADLLDLEAWDLARVRTKDYSSQLIPQMTARGPRQVIAIDPRADLTVAYDDSESAWQPVELLAFDREAEDGDYEPFTLGDNEELNKEALDALKTAVADLEIVDVERKPSGLSGDLKAGDDFYEDRAAVNSLKDRGFAPTNSEGETDILSTEGEVFLTTKEGIEYVLRFGNLQLTAGEQESSGDESADGEEEASGVNRYLFVMARVNEDLIEKPELEIAPEEDASDEEGNETGDDESGDEEDSREAVDKRNQRKQDAYKQKLADAQKRVDELNERFGDWYYVISEEVYKKVSLGRDELIKEKESAAGGDAETGTPPAERGPLGSTGPGIPGLPNVPGINFDPASPPRASDSGNVQDETGQETEGGEVSEAVEEAVETAEETVEAAE